MKEHSIHYQELELITTSNSNQPQSFKFISTLGRLLHEWIALILTVDELKIHALKSKTGEDYWKVHDPLSERSIFFNSETELRKWLDRRYYQ